MGYLLKEALKTLCGVNQWAYAVFWKIGCQNPNVLIWEECYYESASCSGLPGNVNPEVGFHSCGDGSNLQSGIQPLDRVLSLVNRMMIDNHFHIVGEGLVGRAAFTGNRHWILSGNYSGQEHPPEVLKEVCQQFAAGMQTIAVIPALPHGVVQFGSFLTIPENPGFVKNVMALILELGYVSGALLSEDFAAEEHGTRIRAPLCPGNSNPPGGFSFKSNVINPPYSFDSSSHVGNSSQSSTANNLASFSVVETQNGLQSSGTPFNIPNLTPSNVSLPRQCHNKAKIAPLAKLDFSATTQMMNAVAKAEVIPSNPEMWMKQQACTYIPASSGPSNSSLHTEQKMFPNAGTLNHFNTHVSTQVQMPITAKPVLGKDVAPKLQTSGMPTGSYVTDSIGSLAANSLIGYSSDSKYPHRGNTSAFARESNVCKKEMHQNTTQTCDFPLSQYNGHINLGELVYGFVEGDNKTTLGDRFSFGGNSRCDDSYAQPESGDDLFDVLGADFKNQLLSHLWNDGSSNESSPSKSLVSEMYCTSQGNLDTGIFTSAGTDNLLEAVVTKVHPSTDDNVSCRTTLTSTCGTSVPNKSLPCGRFGASDQTKGELLGLPKYPAKAEATSSCSLITGVAKEESGAYSQGSSIYGSQISSWIQKNEKVKQDNSLSTGYCKKLEIGKTTRRRLKPGENPRPRPKDRQMIQDRVKELREIVPNGAKCSIDSLLERTIKHMLFLQSVAKHADKLKQTGESKIISKDGGLLLKDDFEGGATWAYEVGSQSLICPIIVEDLNQPRQMLVEMLCEEQGLFLEIADIIRGLGLTILKGVMETRDEKIWARFAVEANRDVTRMEIFISLVRLLEQSSKTQQNGISNENLMVAHQSHQQGTSIPVVAGGSHHLQ